MSSPTSRSLDYLRAQGLTPQVVERYCPHSRRRIDLYGCIDIVAVGGGVILGVQTTTRSHVGARTEKALAEPRLRPWLASGAKFHVHGWALTGPRWARKQWTCLVRELTLKDFEEVTS